MVIEVKNIHPKEAILDQGVIIHLSTGDMCFEIIKPFEGKENCYHVKTCNGYLLNGQSLFDNDNKLQWIVYSKKLIL